MTLATPRPLIWSAALLVAGLAACHSTEPGPSSAEGAASPIALRGTAHEAAAAVTLPEREPEESPGLHQVFRLSENIISGAEPLGEEALRRVSSMGVKTILSVDGKAPDAETAARYGMRYVHVPIQYKGIAGDELARIAKTFRELPGPFYVHCFHGKHRGPAGAAVGRLVLDGASREQALAEMRQWCGTSKKYEGLYATIASSPMPTAAETAALDFDFAPAQGFEGFRGMMVVAARAHDHLKYLAKRDFAADPAHPDVDALNEATKLAETLRTWHAGGEVAGEPEDFRGWYAESMTAADALQDALARLRNGDTRALGAARNHFRVVTQRCDTCHRTYRNE